MRINALFVVLITRRSQVQILSPQPTIKGLPLSRVAPWRFQSPCKHFVSSRVQGKGVKGFRQHAASAIVFANSFLGRSSVDQTQAAIRGGVHVTRQQVTIAKGVIFRAIGGATLGHARANKPRAALNPAPPACAAKLQGRRASPDSKHLLRNVEVLADCCPRFHRRRIRDIRSHPGRPR